jgi:hypothetical protein
MSGGGLSIGSGGRGISAGDGCSIMAEATATTLPSLAVPALSAPEVLPDIFFVFSCLRG